MCQTCALACGPARLSRAKPNRHANAPEGQFRSLRTQQRAYAFTRAAGISVSQATVLSSPAFASNELVSVPPLSTTVA